MSEKEELITDKDKEVFKQTADIADEFRTQAVKGAFAGKEWYSDRLNMLTGVFMYLSARHASVKTARVNNEVSSYIELKNVAESSGNKFVSASAEREARASVSDFAMAEHLLESYKLAAEQGIMTAKKQLDVYQTELERESR